jgi:hypothetical protein
MKYFYPLVLFAFAIVVHSAPGGNGGGGGDRSTRRLQMIFQPVLASANNFTVACSDSSSIQVNDSLAILNKLIGNKVSNSQDSVCLNSTQLNLETSDSIEMIRDKLDDLFNLEKSSKTDKQRKKWIINIITQANYLAQTFNDSQLISELQDETNFTRVITNWLNSRKDIMSNFNTTCSTETLNLGDLFPQNPDKPDWSAWAPNTCVNLNELRNATHSSLDLINNKLKSLFSEERDKMHPYQKAFSIAVILDIDVWGAWLSDVGFNPWGNLRWTKDPPAATTVETTHSSHSAGSTHSTHSSHHTTSA